MLPELKRAVIFTIVTMLLFGGGYHAALWGLGQIAFPSQAEGSLLRRDDGTVIGSRLIAQAFSGPGYFHPRPSPVDYRAAAAGGSNLGPTNRALIELVQERLAAVAARESVVPSQVPSEMATASGSGLDPHIPPAAARLQAARVAAARGIDPSGVHALIDRFTEPPTLGVLGRARVNVLELNLALDGQGGDRSSGARR